jgi:hypothetical protein
VILNNDFSYLSFALTVAVAFAILVDLVAEPTHPHFFPGCPSANHSLFEKIFFIQNMNLSICMQVGIAGVPADTIMKKTKTLEDNWVPNWNEEFEFPLTVPELALLRIEVHEYDMSEKDDFGGQTCLPISELRSGIRAVPLYSYKGEKYKSVKLLMRFEFV